MLGLTRWSPWTELANLHRDLDSIFSRVFGETFPRLTTDSSFSPAADVRREGDKWMVSIAVPGISPDKLDIDIVGRTVRVRGEREVRSQGDAVVTEINYGRFEREFTLPDEIDVKHAKATYRNGMLDLVLPLTEEAKPHRVQIEYAPEKKQLAA